MARRRSPVKTVQRRMVKKSQLPSKQCLVCGRPFVWRRKWANVWDDVKYCSQRCRRARPQTAHNG